MEQNPTSFFGIIEVQKIVNHIITDQNFYPEFTDSFYKFVHYPDCQQLLIWLPQQGTKYEDIVISSQDNHSKILEEKVENVLSGSVKIILDTLPFPPDKYELYVTAEGQKSFSLFFEKWAEGVEPVVDLPPQQEEISDPDKPPIVYRDGFGNIIPNEDLILRELAFEKLKDQFISKIKYFSTGRDGYLIFTENEKSVRFEMEMGGGECMFFVILPATKNWEKDTGFLLKDRERIVQHIAHMTCREQAGGARYTINETEIIYYKSR